MRLEVLDVRGQVVLIAPVRAGRAGSSLDISALPEGPYVIRASYQDGGSVSARFVKIC
ncbi:MAG: T9SS type A sorting domain-containing protein [Flavobacteriales bacterium]|nr:T9SS type A sorting domain-containing protein [Flavobacteriales bacterium]